MKKKPVAWTNKVPGDERTELVPVFEFPTKELWVRETRDMGLV